MSKPSLQVKGLQRGKHTCAIACMCGVRVLLQHVLTFFGDLQGCIRPLR